MCVPQPRHLRSYKIGNLARWIGDILDRIFCARLLSGEHVLSLSRYPLGKAFLFELRNFLGRIELLYSRCVWAGVDLGPYYQQAPCGCFLPNDRTAENTHYIKQLKAIFPWVTPVDYELFAEIRHSGEKRTSGLVSSGFSHTQEQEQTSYSYSRNSPVAARCHCHCNKPS
jgi:hypothetical protein